MSKFSCSNRVVVAPEFTNELKMCHTFTHPKSSQIERVSVCLRGRMETKTVLCYFQHIGQSVSRKAGFSQII